MMLVDSRWCHHPPFGNCTRCGGFDASPLVSGPKLARGVARSFAGKWVFRPTENQRQPQSKVRERVAGLTVARSESSSSSAASSESYAEPSTGILATPPPGFSEVRQRPWRTDSVTSDSLATELVVLGAAETQLLQVGDEDVWHFRSGPSPGDLAEVEAFCRIFRIAEQVHCAVMEVLCSINDARGHLGPVSHGYNRSNVGDSEVSDINDVALLEEKVVSRLGCIGALVRQQKQEVLGGRLSSLGSSQISQDNSVPPLAQFRAEMKKCCEQLEATLCYYFPPDDEQFAIMHRTFWRLRNVCFDAGYPRPEGSPSQADIPNWAPVRLWSSRGERLPETDNEVVFWRGGQLTEEGLYWLINKGFKVIVDLRAKDSSDRLAKFALDAAVSSGKLRHVSLPVDPGNSPTKDQVAEFARLVADPQSCPLYLHSVEGITRTSSMVARWRETALRSSSQINPITHSVSNNKASFVGVNEGVSDIASDYEDESSLHFADNDKNGSLDHELIDRNSYETPPCINNGKENASTVHAEDVGGFPARLEGSTSMITPFEVQRPDLNIFSKQAMSKFLKGRRVSPASLVWDRTAKVAKLGSVQGDEAVSLISKVAEPAGRWGLDGPGIPRALRKADSVISRKDNLVNVELNSLYIAGDVDRPLASDRISVSSEKAENSVTGEPEEMGSPRDGALFSEPSEKNQKNGALFRVPGVESPLDDTDEPGVVGDMCASTTGVVRLQSRKKAEMYLVRTDGFSCTRERVQESTLAFTHPSTQQQMLMWKTAPKTVLLLKKLGNELMPEAQQVASFLHHQEEMNVLVEPDVHDHFARYPGFGFIQTFYNQDASDLHERVDFVVCLGGDGVILHASNLFRDAVPPVVSFNLGSLGFLTAHPFEDFMQDLRAIIHGNSRVDGVYITLRMRLRCELFRNGKSIPGKTFDVLNEMVVDRGSSPYLCKIECYERNRLITKVQADGVIVATPTGSTAYSTSAGGSMVHPNVPCMLFTPICPHSLSFRPVILPDSAMLELKVPEDARSNAWVSFDGKRRQQLSRGDSVRVCMSKHPLPTVNKSDQTDDWFRSLVRCLNWNERLEQKALMPSS